MRGFLLPGVNNGRYPLAVGEIVCIIRGDLFEIKGSVMKHTYSQLLQLSTAELADLVVAQGAQLDSIKHHQKRIAVPIVEDAIIATAIQLGRQTLTGDEVARFAMGYLEKNLTGAC